MTNWEDHKLGEFICVKHGFAFQGNEITDQDTGKRLVTPGNFHIGGGFNDSKFKYFKGVHPTDYEFKGGEVVVTMTDLSKETDALGYSAKIPKDSTYKYLHNQRVGLVKFLTDSVDKSFIYWLMRTYDYHWFIVGSASGTSIMHTSPSRICEYSFKLPPLPEQRAIASVLSSLDDKIDLLHRQNKTLEAMAETLFRQWFVEEAEEGWPTVKLGDFVKTNVNSITKDFLLNEIRYLDTGSLNEGKIDSYQQFNLADAPSRAKRIVKHNDVLISTVRPNQKHYGVIKNPEEDIIVSTGFCVISCETINPHFVYVYLTTNDMTEYLHTIAEGSTSAYPSLKPSDIENLEFQMPPKEKLLAFSDYADNAWDKIEYNQKQMKNLGLLRDLLLPKLMSGEVRINL